MTPYEAISKTNVTIHHVSNTDEHLFLDLQHGSKRATVSKYKPSDSMPFWVCCKNASHRVWRGPGKSFPSLHQAKDHYRSDDMHAIIDAAVELVDAAGIYQLQPEST